MGMAVLLITAMVPWGTGQLLAAMDRQFMHVEVAGPLKGESRNALEPKAVRALMSCFCRRFLPHRFQPHQCCLLVGLQPKPPTGSNTTSIAS